MIQRQPANPPGTPPGQFAPATGSRAGDVNWENRRARTGDVARDSQGHTPFFPATSPVAHGRAAFADSTRSFSGKVVLYVLVGLWAIVGLPGCSGCTSSQAKIDREAKRKKLEEEEKKKKEKEKPKPDFATSNLMTQPNSTSTAESAFKPGHWTAGTVEMIANNFDFHGELITDPFELQGMPFRLGTSRQAQLPKGQKKLIELVFYVPPGKANNAVYTRLQTPTRREVSQDRFPVNQIPDHQFYFVVLSTTPARYSYLQVLHAVRPPVGFADSGPNAYYRVAMPKVGKRVPLASNPLCWTVVAYLLWDDLDPTLLTPDQQQAMIDWLHWGGRLIVSGPDALDALRTSFLTPYLPATGGESLAITTDLLEKTNRSWTRGDKPLAPGKKEWSGRKLLINPDDRDVQVLLESEANEPLLVERRVGRGSVVLSSFGLSQNELKNWDGLDEFVNACLLRRQPRHFVYEIEQGIFSIWPETGTSMFDASQASDLRYFTRDDTIKRESVSGRLIMAGTIPPRPTLLTTSPDMDHVHPSLWPQNLASDSIDASGKMVRLHGSGVAGWEDFNLPAELARQSLRQAAHIAIPDAHFVALILGIYLAVLVPLNWSVFRLFGRVELAWVAAPAITVAFALAVVKLAQLDIGFARAKTELAVVEFQGSYPRAHVTRYTALYTSLSTRYDFRFDDASALVQPFPPFDKEEGQGLLVGQPRSTVNFRRVPTGDSESGTRITLEGFEVSSNSLGMLHSEHMADLGGIVLQGSRATGLSVVNHTGHDLRGVGVIGKDEYAWIGRLKTGAEANLTFEGGSIEESLWRPDRRREWLAERDEREHVDLQRLARMAQGTTSPGELRLVGWTSDEIPGMSIQPAASQSHGTALFVAHLNHGQRTLPRQDSRPYVAAKSSQDAYDRSQGIVPRLDSMLPMMPEMDDDSPDGDTSADDADTTP